MEMFFLSYVNDASGCDDWRAKRGQEEPPHVRGQGQKPGGLHARSAADKRSYPTSEVRGRGREYQTAMAQEQLRGATPPPRSGWVAERRYPASEIRGSNQKSYPMSEVRGGDERSYPASEVRGRGREELPNAPSPRPRAAAGRSNPTPEAGAVAGRTNPTSKEPWLSGCRRA